MLNLSTRVWTDKEGREIPLTELADTHLLNIQRYLKRAIRNKDSVRSRVENIIDLVDAQCFDKDWYPGRAGGEEIDDMVEEDINQLRVSLMLVSQEVNRRGFNP